MEIEDQFAKDYKSVSGVSGSFDWTTIIDILKTVFTNCSPATVKRFAKAHPVAAQLLVEDKLKESNQTLTAKERKGLAQASVKTISRLSIEEIEQLQE